MCEWLCFVLLQTINDIKMCNYNHFRLYGFYVNITFYKQPVLFTSGLFCLCCIFYQYINIYWWCTPRFVVYIDNLWTKKTTCTHIFFIPSSYGYSKKIVENHKIKKLPPEVWNNLLMYIKNKQTHLLLLGDPAVHNFMNADHMDGLSKHAAEFCRTEYIPCNLLLRSKSCYSVFKHPPQRVFIWWEMMVF